MCMLLNAQTLTPNRPRVQVLALLANVRVLGKTCPIFEPPFSHSQNGGNFSPYFKEAVVIEVMHA